MESNNRFSYIKSGMGCMRLLLVEDDLKTASFIIKGLKEAGFAIYHADDGEDGLHMALHEPYDAAIIDCMLPKLDGLTLISKLRDQKINTPVIILSAKKSVEERIKGLESGSDDYLTKPFAFSELLARIYALIRRATGAKETTKLEVADLSLDLIKKEVIRAGKRIELPPRDLSLLEYLMRNEGRVVSKTMIMEHVWNYDFVPMTNVVEARICLLREKIDKDFDHKLICTIRGAGYVIKNN
jgi:two-component system, OmpR family, response regulator